MGAARFVRTDKFYQGPPDEETRQQYANVGIARYIAYHGQHRKLSFAEIVEQFRRYGRLYDMGWRLRHGEEEAA